MLGYKKQCKTIIIECGLHTPYNKITKYTYNAPYVDWLIWLIEVKNEKVPLLVNCSLKITSVIY